jgi:glycosyltransferase involved in cell wall biosynthesis
MTVTRHGQADRDQNDGPVPEQVEALQPARREVRAVIDPATTRIPGPRLPAGPRSQVVVGRTVAPSLTLSFVIPTLNEAENMPHVLAQLEHVDDIVMVDGMSTDDTVAIAKALRPDIHVIQRPARGKGDALRAGFAAATGDVIVIMDADGSMDPREVDVFTSMIGVGYDLVKGSRLAVGGGSHDLTFIRWAGNRALCIVANQLFDTKWTDLCYGFLAFRRDCLERLCLDADGFEIESQILANAALAGLRIAEIPSVEMSRISGVSHLDARRDGMRVLKTMLAARYSPRAKRSAMALRPIPPIPPIPPS